MSGLGLDFSSILAAKIVPGRPANRRFSVSEAAWRPLGEAWRRNFAPRSRQVAKKSPTNRARPRKMRPSARRGRARGAKSELSRFSGPRGGEAAAWAQHCGHGVLATGGLQNVVFAKAGCIFEDFAFAGGGTKVFVQKTLHYKCTIDRKVSHCPDTPYWHGLRPYRGGFQWASPIPPR